MRAAVTGGAGFIGSNLVDSQPARPGEVLRSCLDVSRARRELRLSDPTELTDGLSATLGWVRRLERAE